MGKIHILQDDVINKIAAGEVVERPASALKELVENALDARAGDISIELENGGMTKISVIDNGFGMDRQDAILAFKRHATSKIKNLDDLFSIASNGFRGEALASIASVGRVTLQTRRAQDEVGTRVTFDAQGVPLAVDWTGPTGTQIYVEDLFHNVPARRRFLKSASTEFAYCHELIQALCVTHPTVHFRLRHNGKELLNLPASTPQEDNLWGEDCFRLRARTLVADEVMKKLIYTTYEDELGKVEMLLSPPGVEKTTGKHIYTFVNRRWVKDKLLRMGVMRGYHSHILKGKFPVCIAHMQLDPSLVDVNVHPAKTELRFQYATEVQNIVAKGIKHELRKGAWAGMPGMVEETQRSIVHSEPGLFSGKPNNIEPPTSSYSMRSVSSRAAQEFSSYLEPRSFKSSSGSLGRDSINMMSSDKITNHDFSFERREPQTDSHVNLSLSKDLLDRPSIPWDELNYIGVFKKCYLLFEAENRLLIVDQHAFHERILYERYMNDRRLVSDRQTLIMPEEVVLKPSEVSKMDQLRESLSSLGFEYKVTSDTTLEVAALPVILSRRSVDEIFESLSHHTEEILTGEGTKNLYHLIVATMACHAAVRAGEELGEDELKNLLKQAGEVDFYHNCPHGRPVFKWFTHRDVASWFERT